MLFAESPNYGCGSETKTPRIHPIGHQPTIREFFSAQRVERHASSCTFCTRRKRCQQELYSGSIFACVTFLECRCLFSLTGKEVSGPIRRSQNEKRRRNKLLDGHSALPHGEKQLGSFVPFCYFIAFLPTASGDNAACDAFDSVTN